MKIRYDSYNDRTIYIVKTLADVEEAANCLVEERYGLDLRGDQSNKARIIRIQMLECVDEYGVVEYDNWHLSAQFDDINLIAILRDSIDILKNTNRT